MFALTPATSTPSADPTTLVGIQGFAPSGLKASLFFGRDGAGTTCLLSGLGYFSLFYLREVDTSDSFVVKGGGWASFGYLSISCWWSLIQCLNISLAGKIFLAVLTLVGNLPKGLPEMHVETWPLSSLRTCNSGGLL